MLTISVTQLNNYVKSVLDGDANLSDIYLKAEVSNLKIHYRSGHIYFKLKDDKSSVNAVMFSWYAKHLKFEPQDGEEVLVKASISLYEAEGAFQAYVVDMQPIGYGQSKESLTELSEKLEKKGYYLIEHKKALPKYPDSIGVITSKTGAVIEDIKEVVSRRYPLAKIKLYSSIVQGEEAVESLVAGLKTLDKNCDVIIIARGGGSAEDLGAFNSEKLADQIFKSHTPIISAVGHETDVTICDLVADRRAGTPSIAAEMATPDEAAILEHLKTLHNKAKILVINVIDRQNKRLEYLSKAQILASPMIYIKNKQKQLDFIHKTMYNLKRQLFREKENELVRRAAVLETLNPMSVLSRGYGAVFKDNKPVTSIVDVKKCDEIKVKLKDGMLSATVNEITQE